MALLQAYGYLALLSSQPQDGVGHPDFDLTSFETLTQIVTLAAGTMLADVDRRAHHRARHRQRHQLHHLRGHRGPGLPGGRRARSCRTPDLARRRRVRGRSPSVAVAVIVYIQEGQRRIPIQYASRVRGRRMYQGGATFLPLRVNQAGVIPIIFAVSILLFPVQLATYFTNSSDGLHPGHRATASSTSSTNRALLYVMLYFLLTVGFTYFYTAFTFKPDETADQLRKNGGFIPGIRPGAPTRDYLAKVVYRISLAGALFLGIVAVSPILASSSFARQRRRLVQPRRHGAPDRRLGGRRDDEAARGAADDAQLRGLHPLTRSTALAWRGR